MWQDDLIGVAKFVNACLNRMTPPPPPPFRGVQHLISLVWLEDLL